METVATKGRSALKEGSSGTYSSKIHMAISIAAIKTTDQIQQFQNFIKYHLHTKHSLRGSVFCIIIYFTFRFV